MTALEKARAAALQAYYETDNGEDGPPSFDAIARAVLEVVRDEIDGLTRYDWADHLGMEDSDHGKYLRVDDVEAALAEPNP